MKSGIIGLGTIGKVHASVLDSQRREIAAVCDVEESLLAPYPNCAHYSDYLQMLDEAKPDVVHICTPHYLHAEMIVAALERNINVLCEKPLCIQKKDIPRILEAEKRSKAQLGVCLQNRYNAANVFVKDYLCGERALGGTGSVVWHRDEAYYATGAWRGKWRTEGGGVLINQALHTLDLLEWFLGEPRYVAASTSNLTLQGKIEEEDTASVLCFGETNFSFFATNGSAAEFPVEMTLQTEKGPIKILPDTVLIDGRAKTFADERRAYGKYCYGTGHGRLISDFYECVSENRKFAIDGTEGAKVVKLILSAYESGGKKIEIAGTPGESSRSERRGC